MPQSAIILAVLAALHSPISAIYIGCLPMRISAQASANEAKEVLAGDAINQTSRLADELIEASYPDLKGSNIVFRTFRSRSDYFKARFGVPQYFFARMRYLIFVNPQVFKQEVPASGVRAIIAHELAHVVYLKQRNRLQLLGLVRLTSKRFSAEFERWADLKAISLGYAKGLKEYRLWLYQNVPASKVGEKRRNYFSPEEIDAIVAAAGKRPELLEYWFKHVPLNLNQILAATQ